MLYVLILNPLFPNVLANGHNIVHIQEQKSVHGVIVHSLPFSKGIKPSDPLFT